MNITQEQLQEAIQKAAIRVLNGSALSQALSQPPQIAKADQPPPPPQAQRRRVWKSNTFAICKADRQHGILMGWAMICKKRDANGNFVDYIDTQNDKITEKAMLDSAVDFMKDDSSRILGHEHQKDDNGNPINKGRVVFAFPMTTEIMKSMGINSNNTGLIIGVKPNDPEMLEKFDRGELNGFSIGGWAEEYIYD